MSDNNDNNMKDKTGSNTAVIKEEATKESPKKTDKIVASPVSTKEMLAPATLTSDELALLDYADFSTPARMLALGEVLCKSQLVPLKTPQDVMTALMTGKELGLPFITSVSQIYPINGRPTLGAHIQRALCLKNGIIIEKLEDAVEIYEFVKADADGKPITKTITKDNKPIQVPIILSKGVLEDQPKSSLKRAIDKRTTYRLTREIKQPSGKFKEVIAKGSFSLSEAREAELTDKDVWIKYWRRMLDARAFTNAVKEIASDITLGLSAPNELSNNFYINDNDEEVHIPIIEQQE